MSRKILVPILLVGALTVVTIFGVVAYRTVRAAAPIRNGFAFFGPGKGMGGGFTNQDLANALGITVDQLNSAYQKADSAALDQAVKAGLITQAQADQLRSQGSAFPFGSRWGEWLSRNGIDYNALLADALGITVDKLNAAYTQAYNARIDQAVKDGRITQEQADLMKGQYALFSSQKFQSSMQSAFEAAVKQAVTDGVITQAQADQILKNESSMGFPALKGFGSLREFNEFNGFHGFGRFGRHGGWGGGNAAPSNPAPSGPAVTPSSGL